MYEFHHILVPTDFSRHAEAALEHAVLLGSRFGAEITLLHVDEFSVSPLGASETRFDYVDAYQAGKEAFFEEKFAEAKKCVAHHPVRLKTQVKSGRAYKVIVEESERQDYDVIVIATRGWTHLSEYLIGGTTERVVRLSRQPVLSIQTGPEGDDRFASVLCPTDFSPAGNVALPYALSIARQNKVPLYIQYISDLEKPEPEEAIRKRMPRLEDHHPAAGEVKVEFLFDRDVEPSNSIIRLAQDRDVGLIVMSTHGRKGLRRVYIGNNTAEVVRQSTRPVLTVTHPVHKKIFSHPVTEKLQPPLRDHINKTA